MKLTLPDTARDFARSIDHGLVQADGPALLRAAEADPALRHDVRALLDGFGMLELDPRGDIDEAVAAMEACRVAGAHLVPWPVAAQLAGNCRGALLAVIDPARPRIVHGDLDGWIGTTLDGQAHEFGPNGDVVVGKLLPFVTPVQAGAPVDDIDEPTIATALWLQAATAVGALQTACRLTTEHVTSRHQFGKPLVQFQTVRFKLADMTVAVRGIEELLRFTAWSVSQGQSRAPLVDALALRVAVQERGKWVLAAAHQLHGAIGFCDEHDLTLVSRHLQPLLRIPFDLEVATEVLDTQVRARGVSVLCSEE